MKKMVKRVSFAAILMLAVWGFFRARVSGETSTIQRTPTPTVTRVTQRLRMWMIWISSTLRPEGAYRELR
jgi:hypothetical protein